MLRNETSLFLNGHQRVLNPKKKHSGNGRKWLLDEFNVTFRGQNDIVGSNGWYHCD